MPALANGASQEPVLFELLAALPSQLQPHLSHPEDNAFLRGVLGEKGLRSLVKIHERLKNFEASKPIPVLDTTAALARESLLLVHDTVAKKGYDPELPPLPDDIDDNEDSVKIIRLVKNKEPLGATIRRDDHTGAIIVARIMRGGAADRSGLIHPGDELKEVNGIPVEDKKPEEIIHILAQSQGAITFKVVPGVTEDGPVREPKVFLKALFDYDPSEDRAIPCMEAGLAFKKGSILQIMSQEDATWWQAKHEGDANSRAGLIPSKQFQERRFALRQPIMTQLHQRSLSRQPYEVAVESEEAAYFSGFHIAGFRKSFRLSRRDKKTNKSMYESKKSEMYDMADVPTYEEVAPYRRQRGAKHRLVVLVGPTGVGLNELKRKLLISDPQHYSVTIPHTSRAKRTHETDGVEYHFISRHLFETDIHNSKFIEYGEYKGNYYGTSLDSVRSVLSKNKVCLLDVQPHTIKHLRTAEMKPFVVFVKPPTIDRLRETRKSAKIISSKDDKGSAKSFTEEDFQDMMNTTQTMESQYGYLFDKVIVNDDLSTAFNELLLALKEVETQTHWVPVCWTHS
ncbi:MAGUK p55 subfamily member 7 isoform X4 [Nothobranchius furzeri]|uniref:MAGUK p55 subfamily member 7 isoform X4 n=1 Tax=Nothobranchius furzeri TaxID=105023 RepID=UPI003904A04A